MATTAESIDAMVEIKIAPRGISFPCKENETLLFAGLREGIDLPYECASGACGSCRCKLVSGNISSIWNSASGLSERDRRKGDIILMCQSQPRGDLTLNVEHANIIETPRPNQVVATVKGIRPVTPTMYEIELQLSEKFTFLPGQFLLVDIPNKGRRAYSMANVQNKENRLNLIIKEVPEGNLSPHLCRDVPVGSQLSIEGPYGRAWFRADSARPIIAIAGGSGLAPIWSIAQAAVRENSKEVHVYFGVNDPTELCYQEEFDKLKSSYGNLTINQATVSGGRPDCRTGNVGDVVLADFPDLKPFDVYMAGPPAMIDSLMMRLMGEQKVDGDHLYFDRFT